jgi:shikimate kinase
MHLILIGFRGTGKSTVARLLAERLAMRMVDTDALVEATAGQSIADIFLHRGEPGFRDLEAAALAEACADEPAVIAAGGGVVLRGENRELIARTCKAVWLTATAESIARRVEADESTRSRRPKLTKLDSRIEIEQLLATREPFYRGCAEMVVDTEGKTAEQVAAEILAQVGEGFASRQDEP